MRNLKKFLALMLAMIMAMSLMVTANATSTAEDFADGAGITPEFAEAVDVLSGMKVFSGDNGNFKPASNITRAEMAAVIYRLVSGDVTDSKAGLYSNYAPFKDVTSDKWYAGYVGYCWNAGLIKGRNAETFDPTGNVTGYEALAMLLRAVGYDKNGEFTGSTWQVNVASLSGDLGILIDVNTTQYGSSLHGAARRDVIASLVFRTAAYVPTVTYTPAMGYNKYIGVPITGGNDLVLNRTLGYKAFGLAADTGIVVGNQETGETVTRVSFSNLVNQDVYAYSQVGPGNTASYMRSINSIVTFDAKTGLDLFAHKVEIWFDARNTELNPATFGTGTPFNWNESKQNNNLHTYAYFDRATLADVVKVNPGPGDTRNNVPNLLAVNAPTAKNDAAKAGMNLYDAAKAAGFAVDGSTTVYQNEAFSRFLPIDSTAVTDANGDTIGYTPKAAVKVTTIGNVANGQQVETSPQHLYLLISNSANKGLDVVISLNIQTSEITGVDNVNSIKTVTMPITPVRNNPFDPTAIIAKTDIAGETDGNTGWQFIDENNNLNNTLNGYTLDQAQLTEDSTKTLNQYEIGVRINGTAPIPNLPQGAQIGFDPYTPGTSTATSGEALGYQNPRNNAGGLGTYYENAWFKLQPVTNTKEGTVVSYNPVTGKVNLQDGTVLERSVLYNTVVENTLPQIGATDNYLNTTYRFWLTPEGKYLGAEIIYGQSFIYGTYADYDQKTSSSTFNYFLTGVTLDGKTTTVPVTHINGDAIPGNDMLGVPYRDTNNATGAGKAVNGIGYGVYSGFTLDGTKLYNSFSKLDEIGVVAGGNDLNEGDGIPICTPTPPIQNQPTVNDDEPMVHFTSDDTNPAAAGDIVIDSNAVTLGAKLAGYIDIDGKDGTVGGTYPTEKLYFTEQTKFILVSGYGEDNVKAEIYNGIKELRGDAKTVTLHMNDTIVRAADLSTDPDDHQLTISNICAGTTIADMTYLQQRPFVFSQNRVLSREANVIILPKAAVQWSTTETTYYLGNSQYTLINADYNATQFTMYNSEGVAESKWILGQPGDLAYASSTSTLIANGHDLFYNLTETGEVANDGQPIYYVRLSSNAWSENKFTATTLNGQTGNFEAQLTDTDCTSTGHPVGRRDMVRVEGATVKNLNVENVPGKVVWPGINSVKTLTDAGSLGLYNPGNQYGGDTPLYVSVPSVSNLSVKLVYVCFDQNPNVDRPIGNPTQIGD